MSSSDHEPEFPTVRFAVVGTGWAGIRHLEAFKAAGPGLEAVAICDIDRGQAESVARRFGLGTVATRLEELLEDPGIDVIDICTPHDLHASMAVDAARAGKHVLVEKPMSAEFSQAVEMIETAEEMGVALGVSENLVYDESSKTVSAILERGDLGNPVFAVGSWGFRAHESSYPGRRSWLLDPARGGTGTWMLQGIHHVAQLRYLFGEVALVYAVEYKTSSFTMMDIEGTVGALLTFACGLPVHLTQSSEIDDRPGFQGLTIHCEEGTIRATDFEVQIAGPQGQDEERDRTITLDPDPLLPYVRELQSFARHVALGAEFPTSGRNEIASLAVVEAGYRSIRIGVPVTPQAL